MLGPNEFFFQIDACHGINEQELNKMENNNLLLSDLLMSDSGDELLAMVDDELLAMVNLEEVNLIETTQLPTPIIVNSTQTANETKEDEHFVSSDDEPLSKIKKK